MADASPQDPWVPPNTFGARLALIRQAKGWNVRQAAEHCGVPEQTWHNWEDGKSPRDLQAVAEKLAAAVPCDRVWLLAGVESRKTRSEKSERVSHLRKVVDNPNPNRGRLAGQMPLLATT